MGAIKEKSKTILKDGYLLKQGDVFKLQWHLRYFVLTKECLCYYKNEEESLQEVPRGVIFFNDMSLFVEYVACEKSKTKYCLKIVKRSTNTSNRTLTISTFCEEERNDWLAQLLLAKAMALVCDRSWIGGNDPELLTTRPRSKTPPTSTTYYTEKLATAKQAIKRCGRRLSGSNRGGCSFEEVRRRKRSTTNVAWRHTLIDLTAVY